MAELSVEISGKMDGLNKALNDSQKALLKFEKQAEVIKKQIDKNLISTSKLASLTEKLNNQYSKGLISQSKYENLTSRIRVQEEKLSTQTKNLYTDLNRVNRATKQLSDNGITPLNKGVVSGTSAMTAFSRTIQDAPFGIMGVSNNITNLTEQFGYLQKKTGSAKGALTAMLRDLKGFGGISFAISAATSLLLVFGDELEDLLKSNNKLKNAFEESSESIGNQVNELTSLVDALKDSNTSTEDKYKIIDKLNKDYPSYFSNLNKENASIDNITRAYENQKNALIGLGIAKALEAKKAPEYAKLAELELKSASELLSTSDLLSFANLSGGIGGSGIGGGTSNSAEIEKRIKEQAEITKKAQIKAIENNIADIDKAVDKIRKKYDVSTSDFLGLNNDTNGGVLPFDEKVIENTAKAIQHTFAEGAGDLGFVAPDDTHTEYLDGVLKGLQKHIDENTPTIKPEIETTEFEEKTRIFSENVSSIMQNGVVQTFNSLGENIGNALATGSNLLDAFGQAVLSSLGGILQQYGALVVATGFASEAFKQAMVNPFGGGIAAIAAGTALIAIGSAVKSFSSSLGSGSTSSSGSVSSDTSTYSGSSSTTYSSGSSSSSSLQNVVFELQGTKLIGVINNTLKKNKALGGSNLIYG